MLEKIISPESLEQKSTMIEMEKEYARLQKITSDLEHEDCYYAYLAYLDLEKSIERAEKAKNDVKKIEKELPDLLKKITKIEVKSRHAKLKEMISNSDYKNLDQALWVYFDLEKSIKRAEEVKNDVEKVKKDLPKLKKEVYFQREVWIIEEKLKKKGSYNGDLVIKLSSKIKLSGIKDFEKVVSRLRERFVNRNVDIQVIL